MSNGATTEGITSSVNAGEMDKFETCDRGEMNKFATCNRVKGWGKMKDPIQLKAQHGWPM
jgi:hypothetical protein